MRSITVYGSLAYPERFRVSPVAAVQRVRCRNCATTIPQGYYRNITSELKRMSSSALRDGLRTRGTRLAHLSPSTRVEGIDDAAKLRWAFTNRIRVGRERWRGPGRNKEHRLHAKALGARDIVKFAVSYMNCIARCDAERVQSASEDPWMGF